MIEFQNVYKTYDNGTVALRDLSLKINKGEFVFIVGASGAGKSTFLKLIMKEEEPNSGDIILNNKRLSRVKKKEIPYLRRSMGIVFQDFRLIDKMNIYDNIAFAMHVTGATPRQIKNRVPYILELVGLSHKAKSLPNEISGGEQQRVGLARALVNDPDVIIADEPTGNIDPVMAYEIVDLLSEINKQGTTILMVTHAHSLVKHFRRRIVEINGGQVVGDTAATLGMTQEIILEREGFSDDLDALSGFISGENNDYNPQHRQKSDMEAEEIAIDNELIDVIEDVEINSLDEIDADDIDMEAINRTMEIELSELNLSNNEEVER